MVLHCDFNLHFPKTNVKHIFMCLFTTHVSSLKKLLKSFSHFLTELLNFSNIEFQEFCIYYGQKSFIRYMVYKYFLKVLLVFPSLKSVI